MAERNEFDFLRESLRESWNKIEPPQPYPSLDRTDPETRRVVEWMGSAWSAAQPEPARLPWRLRLKGPGGQSARGQPNWVRGSAAAAALVMAVFGLSRLLREPARPVELTGVEGVLPLSPFEGERPAIASITHDRTEIRSGPVRLILFSQDPSDLSTSKEAR